MPANTDLVQQIEAQKKLMIEVATGGPRIQDTNEEYKGRRLNIKAALWRKQIDDPNPFADLWAWYGRWSSGDLPSYQSRRVFIAELYQSLLDRLRVEDAEHPSEPIFEETGWTRVDRGIDKIRIRLETAESEEDYQTVGLLCRETLISLAQAVFDPEQHSPSDGTVPSRTDAYRMLEAYFSAELAGGPNEALRRHAKASNVLANALTHSRTASFRHAALGAEATRSVVNISAIISGKRDPEVVAEALGEATSGENDDPPF